MSPFEINLQNPRPRRVVRRSERIVVSDDGNHFFTFRPDWRGPAPLPFRAAAATVSLVPETIARPRVLILGYGLGAVAGMMLRRRPCCSIVGAESDLELHRGALAACPEGVELHLTDAVTFLRRSTDAFDLVLDDCFVVKGAAGGCDEPYRPRELEVVPELARSVLSQGGLYARNLLHQDDLPLEDQRAVLHRLYRHVAERSFRDWDNVLAVACDRSLDRHVVKRLGTDRA